MNYDQLAEKIREGLAVIAATDLEIRDRRGNVWRGSGALTLSHGEFKLRVVLPRGSTLPEWTGGYSSRKDFWFVRGWLEDLPFLCRFCPPSTNMSESRGAHGHHRAIDLNLDGIDLLRQPISARFASLLVDIEESLTQNTQQLPKRLWKISVEATIADYPNPFPDQRTETVVRNAQIGASKGWTLNLHKRRTNSFSYALWKPGDDLKVIAEWPTSKRTRPRNVRRDWQALLQALAFITGKSAWPWRTTIFVNGSAWVERFRPVPLQVPTTIYTPFHAAQRRQDKRVSRALALAARCFAESPLASRLQELLHAMRTASEKNLGLKALSHCVLLEGLIRALFTFKAPRLNRSERKEMSLTGTTRDQVFAWLDEHLKSGSPAPDAVKQRIKGSLGRVNELPPRTMFLVLARQFRLPDMTEFLPAFQIRGKLAHGRLESDLTPVESIELWKASALATAAFNILVLKAVGYSGPCVRDLIGHRGIEI